MTQSNRGCVASHGGRLVAMTLLLLLWQAERCRCEEPQSYLVSVYALAMPNLETTLLPQLQDYATRYEAEGVVFNVYRVIDGPAFSGFACDMTALMSAHVQNQTWVAELFLDIAVAKLGFRTNVDAHPQLTSLLPNALAATPTQAATPYADESGAPWQLDRIDQRSDTLNGQFEYSLTGTGVDMYILDSGVNIAHEDLAGRVVAGINFNPDQATTDYSDCDGHGTHVTGLAAGTTYGVAKTANIIAVRIYGCTGSGPVSQALAGINYILTRMQAEGSRRAVINMSFGGTFIQVLNTAVAALVTAGGVVVTAAGNDAEDACVTSPAGASGAIAAAASDESDSFASFSNSGACVAIIAPGVAVTSDWIGSATATQVLSGTSMASPLAAGVCALILEANPVATPAEVRSQLLCTSTAGVVTSLPSAATPDSLLFAPPGGFPAVGLCGISTASGAQRAGEQLAGALLTALAACTVAASMALALETE